MMSELDYSLYEEYNMISTVHVHGLNIKWNAGVWEDCLSISLKIARICKCITKA